MSSSGGHLPHLSLVACDFPVFSSQNAELSSFLDPTPHTLHSCACDLQRFFDPTCTLVIAVGATVRRPSTIAPAFPQPKSRPRQTSSIHSNPQTLATRPEMGQGSRWNTDWRNFATPLGIILEHRLASFWNTTRRDHFGTQDI